MGYISERYFSQISKILIRLLYGRHTVRIGKSPEELFVLKTTIVRDEKNIFTCIYHFAQATLSIEPTAMLPTLPVHWPA